MAAYDRNYSNQKFNRQQGGNDRRPQLPNGYLEGGYYETVDGEKVMKKEYIVKYPKEIAKALEDSKKNKRSQIRKFYEYTLSVQTWMKKKGASFDLIEAELDRLLPYVTYAKSRDKVSDLFEEFINKNVSSIHDARDLTAFIKHFEAIVAYLPKERN